MITIIDYKAGNQTSVKRALDHMSIPNQISADPAVIRSAERLIFPGVGHARASMEVLAERELDGAIKDAFAGGIPILGICIGSQIILDRSDEGDTTCLGLIPGEAKKFQFTNNQLKIPHMGWNEVKFRRDHALFESIPCGSEFYFVHSFYPLPASSDAVYAYTEYGIEFPAVIGNKNLIAAQFHAEKSGHVGLRFLRNFNSWKPEAANAE